MADYQSPLSERESLLLGDFIVAEARKERRPAHLWHFGFEGRGPHYALRTLRDFGFWYVTSRELQRLIGRE